MRTKNTLLMALVALSVVSLSGCGGSDKKKPETQVVAKVNGKEITVHQLNFVLQGLGKMDEKQAKEAGAQALNALVEQEAILQKAIEAKLDRDPKVVQAVEAARRQLLTQAYMEKQLQGYTPRTEEISKYYREHPELFEHRKIFKFNQVFAVPRPEQADALREKIAGSGNDWTAILNWIKEQKIPARANTSEEPAEKLPMDQLSKLSQLKQGDVFVVTLPNGVGAMQLVSAREQPVTEAQATPVIQRFLVNQKQVEVAKAEVKRIKDAAKIEYLGSFADQGKQSVTANKAADAAKPDEAAKPSRVDETAKSMEKGLSGLN